MGKQIVYPYQLKDMSKQWSTIVFRPDVERRYEDSDNPSRTVDSVMLYMPLGITFNDGASYNQFNLGALGSVAQKALDDLNNGIMPVMSNYIPDTSEASGTTTARSLIGFKIANRLGTPASLASAVLGKFGSGVAIGASSALGGEVGDALLFNQKVVQNPNIASAFTGMNVRTFEFKFKLIANSLEETYDIQDIIRFFRYNAYPTGDYIALDYPPTFNISFRYGTKKNTFIPEIYQCYLTTVTSDYNATTNAVHFDGSPIEYNVSLSFSETKSLTRDDIIAMSKRTEDERGSFSIDLAPIG